MLMVIRRAAAAACLALLALAPVAVHAQDASLCDKIWKTIRSNCEGARSAWNDGDWDLYLSGYIHHGKGTYSAEKLQTFNSKSWGGGLGKRYVDDKGRTHLLYGMAIEDSHFKPQYIAGYGWLAHWRPLDSSSFRLGGGFTAFLTARTDYSHYLAPVPGILPLGEVAWDRVSIMATYVPRLSRHGGNGDVLMVFGKIAF